MKIYNFINHNQNHIIRVIVTDRPTQKMAMNAPFDEGDGDGFEVFGTNNSAAQPAPMQM